MTYKEKVYAHVTLAQAERFWTKIQICSHGDECSACCWEWQGTRNRAGYGGFFSWMNSTTHRWTASRIMGLFVYGDIPEGRCVLHACDNPPCCNPAHLWLGTKGENNRDSVRKGRHLVGERHPLRANPLLAARGEQHGLRKHPERVTRGDRHWTRTHPHKVLRGENRPTAKLTASLVREIRRHRTDGWTTQALAERFQVAPSTIRRVMTRALWKDVEQNDVEDSRHD